MPPKHNFTVEYKCELLEHLIDNSRTFRDSDLSAFFDYCRTSFDGLKGTTWAGQDLEDKLRAEERIWLNECQGNRGRRRGHEKGSYYDHLMSKWKHIWNKMLVRDWQNSVDVGARSWEEVPRSLQKDLKKPASTSAAPASQDSALACTSTSTSTSKSKSTSTSTSNLHPQSKHELSAARIHDSATFSEAKLETAVNAAVKRAIENKKEQSAEAVLAIYEDSKDNADLRQLLVAVLLETSTPSENERFQVYVQAIKKRLRDARKAEARLGVAREAAVKEAAIKLEHDSAKATLHQTVTTSHVRSPSSNKSDRVVAIGGGKSEDSSHRRPIQTSVHISVTGNDDVVGNDIEEKKDTLDFNLDKSETLKAQLQGDRGAACEAASLDPKSAEKASSKDSRRSDESSDSGYETTERHPYRDPLVTKVLGDLQYEPSVQMLLGHDKPLGSDANICTLQKRRTALEIIKTILVDFPAAKTDLQVLMERLQEMDSEGRASEIPQQKQNASDVQQKGDLAKNQYHDQEASVGPLRREVYSRYEDAEEDAGNEQLAMDEEIAPRPTRSLRARESAAEAQSKPERHNGWPCPTATDTGSTNWFSSSEHATRDVRTHTGVNDLVCVDCDKRLMREDNTMEHFRHGHRDRVDSRKRLRMSGEEVAAEAETLVAEPAVKRQKTESDTAEPSHVLNNGNSRDSSPLTELFSEDEKATEKAMPAAPTSQLASPAKRTIHPLWPVTENEIIAARHTGALTPTYSQARPSPLHKSIHQSASISPSLPSTNFPTSAQAVRKQSADTPAPPLAISRDAAVARLEAKIDSLLQGQSPSAHSPQDSEHAMVSSAESLLKIANSLKEGVLEGQTPDLTRMVARLTRTAAQAVIDAANSAKRAAEAARDISAVLEETVGRTEPTGTHADAGAAAPVAKV